MATINQLRRERIAFYKELKRGVRSLDSAVERLQRHVDSVLDRRRDLPETSDLEQFLYILYQEVSAATVNLEGMVIPDGERLFNLP